LNLLPTTLVGSHPQPELLIDRKNLEGAYDQSGSKRRKMMLLWRSQSRSGGQAYQPIPTRKSIAQSSLDCSILEILPGKTIILGVLDLSNPQVEDPETVAARIRRALRYVSADRIVVAPDGGMKYLPRDVAFAEMQAMVAGAALFRSELVKGQSA
jgi:methionine synthase II (cobalamin-independent)